MKCTLCGRTMCRRCQRNIAAEILCFQCQNFLKKQEQLSFKQKDAKRIQIIAYLRTLRRWISVFSLLLPGIAHCFKGRFIQGTVFSFIFFLLLSKAVVAFLFKGPWYDLVNDRAVYIFVYALTAGIVWCALFVHVRSVRSRELEDNVVVMSLGLDA